MVTKG